MFINSGRKVPRVLPEDLFPAAYARLAQRVNDELKLVSSLIDFILSMPYPSLLMRVILGETKLI